MNIDRDAAWKALWLTLITFGIGGGLYGYMTILIHLFGVHAVLIGPLSILVPLTFLAFYFINKEL